MNQYNKIGCYSKNGYQVFKDEEQCFTNSTLEKGISSNKIERCKKIKNKTLNLQRRCS